MVTVVRVVALVMVPEVHVPRSKLLEVRWERPTSQPLNPLCLRETMARMATGQRYTTVEGMVEAAVQYEHRGAPLMLRGQLSYASAAVRSLSSCAANSERQAQSVLMLMVLMIVVALLLVILLVAPVVRLVVVPRVIIPRSRLSEARWERPTS